MRSPRISSPAAALLLVALGWLTPLAGLASANPESLLRALVGEWHGELIVQSVDGGEQQVLQVRQRYWWDTIGLRGEAIYGHGERQFTASSLATVMDDRIISEIERDGKKNLLRGLPMERGILWLPLDSTTEPTMQLREFLERDDKGQWRIRISGHEVRSGQLQSRRYLIRGSLQRQ